MKFINYLESISGVGIFPLISLMIFFIFFIVLGIKVAFLDAKLVDKLNRLPLEDDMKETELNN